MGLADQIIENEFSDEEKRIFKVLSRPPLCMHESHIERESEWECKKCGLIAPKTISGWG